MTDSFFDPEELRKIIKDVKIQCIALEKQQRVLSEENVRYEEKCAALQREFNILSALAEAESLEEDTGGAFSSDEVCASSNEQRKWAEAERKLELQILNADIRSALFKLEADALQAETTIHSLGKQASIITQGGKEGSDKAVPTSMFQKSLDELEEDMGATVEARVKLRALMALDADAKRKEKTALMGKISVMRDQLYSLLDEREALREALKNVQLNLHGEEARVSVWLDKHMQIRNLIEPFHDGRGWQLEAFLRATGGSREAEVSVENLPRILQPWIPDPDVDLSLDTIKEVLRGIPGATTVGNIGLEAFILLANHLANCSEN